MKCCGCRWKGNEGGCAQSRFHRLEAPGFGAYAEDTMIDSEALPASSQEAANPRLTLHDRGPWIFALYWYSFQFRLGDEPPQRAMSFFGLSSELRTVFLGSERTATLARRFDLRSRVLMAICFIPGIVCLSSFIVLCGLPGHLAATLRDQYPTLGTALVALSLLALALLAMFTRELYRSFKALFEAYNTPEKSDVLEKPNAPTGVDKAEDATKAGSSAPSDQSASADQPPLPPNP
jgi:hypothetical protein